MTRSELMKKVESRLGRKIPVTLVTYARQRGIIATCPAKRFGWLDYPEMSVDQLVEYCQTRSRLFASVSSSQASGK